MMAFDANTLYDAEKTKVKYDEMWAKCTELYNICKTSCLASYIDTKPMLVAFSQLIKELSEHTDLVPRHIAFMHSEFITKSLNISAGLTAVKNETGFDFDLLATCELEICSFIHTEVHTLPSICFADLQRLHSVTVDLYEIWTRPEFDFEVFSVKIKEFLHFAGTTPELHKCKAGLAFIEQCLAGITDNTTEYYKTYMSTGSATNTILDIFSDIKLRAKDSISKNKYKIISDIQKIGSFVMNRANSNQTPIVAKIKENLTTCLGTLDEYLTEKRKKHEAREGAADAKPGASTSTSTSTSSVPPPPPPSPANRVPADGAVAAPSGPSKRARQAARRRTERENAAAAAATTTSAETETSAATTTMVETETETTMTTTTSSVDCEPVLLAGCADCDAGEMLSEPVLPAGLADSDIILPEACTLTLLPEECDITPVSDDCDITPVSGECDITVLCESALLHEECESVLVQAASELTLLPEECESMLLREHTLVPEECASMLLRERTLVPAECEGVLLREITLLNDDCESMLLREECGSVLCRELTPVPEESESLLMREPTPVPFECESVLVQEPESEPETDCTAVPECEPEPEPELENKCETDRTDVHEECVRVILPSECDAVLPDTTTLGETAAHPTE